MSAFEFDPAKQKKNLRVHKIGLDVGARIFEGFTIEAEDDRFDYGEERLALLWQIFNRWWILRIPRSRVA